MGFLKIPDIGFNHAAVFGLGSIKNKHFHLEQILAHLYTLMLAYRGKTDYTCFLYRIMSNQPKTPKTLEELPYSSLNQPEYFKDTEPLGDWWSEQPLEDFLKWQFAFKGFFATSLLLQELALKSHQKTSADDVAPNEWFKFRKPRDKQGENRVITPEFDAPPTIEDIRGTRLYLFPPSEHSVNGLAVTERVALRDGEETVYRGHEILWTPGDNSLTIGIRNTKSKDSAEGNYRMLKTENPKHDKYITCATKIIVAAYVKFCSEESA